MSKRLIFLILVFLMSVVPTASGFAAEKESKIPLRDGFVLRGVDGKLTGSDGNDVWFFEFHTDVNDYRGGLAPAGTKLELLPSSTLEKMIADVNERSTTGYRLSGWVTKYKGKNFIFPNYFLRSQPPQKPQPRESEPAEKPSVKEDKRQPAVTEPNDALDIPQEILEKLKKSRITPSERPGLIPKAKKQVGDLATKTELKRDSVLTDRTAFLRRLEDGPYTFVLDALGRNVRPVSFRLLPCEVLELTEQRQSALPGPVRFKIAGIVTKYKGRTYLLPQKATRVYSHQNFDR
jgi:hypothetical protein